MPLALILGVIDIILVVHAAKTGRFSPWAYVILLIPGFGGLAYVLTDLLTHMRRAPKYVRKVQAEWIGMAEKALRG